MSDTRRSVVRRSAGLLGASLAGSLAGCAGAGDGSGDGTTNGGGGGEFDSGYAMFFPLHDWASRVAGDHATFTNPVDVGQLGHGWEPSGTLTAEVAASDVFVYFDSPEFTWAQDLASTLESDYEEVAVIDGLRDLDERLLAWDHGRESHDGEHEDEHAGEEGSDHGDETDDGHDHETDDGHDHETDDGHDHETDDGHDHEGEIDPHVWVDPVLATDVVDTIAAGLGEADPDNADDYAANAEAYNAELAEVDEAFAATVEAAERDVVVLAGHDSFQYLAERYGFEVHSPVGVSPQNEPSGSDIADTIAVVDDNDIDVVLYDRFASTNLAETIVENSGATETMAVTPAGGSTREWNEAGYGYREQMLEINVPAFSRALGAE